MISATGVVSVVAVNEGGKLFDAGSGIAVGTFFSTDSNVLAGAPASLFGFAAPTTALVPISGFTVGSDPGDFGVKLSVTCTRIRPTNRLRRINAMDSPPKCELFVTSLEPMTTDRVPLGLDVCR